MRRVDHWLHRDDRAERVRDVGDRHNASPLVEQPLVRRYVDLTRVVDRHHSEDRALLLTEHLPGHDVRVVLQRRNHDLVTRPHRPPAVGLGHEVDPFGGATHEDDLARLRRIQEPLDPRAGSFVRLGGALTQPVHAPVHVGVVRRVVAREGIDHGLRLLGGRGVVQVDERFAVHLLVEDGEILPDALDVPRHGGRHRRSLARLHGDSSTTRPPRRRPVSRSSHQLRIGPTRIRPSTSLANPCVSRVRAAASSSPRLFR